MSLCRELSDGFDDSGPLWSPFDADDEYNGPQRYTCRQHPERGFFTGLTQCLGCVYDNPKRPADVEIQDWWSQAQVPAIVPHEYCEKGLKRFGHLDFTRTHPGLHCSVHDRFFENDEACSECMADDAEAQDEA